MSQGIRFLYNFALGQPNVSNPGANILSITSEAAGDFSKANLCTTPLRQVWRSTGVALQEIIIQTDDATDPINTFALLNHNLSEDAVVTLQANHFNNFTAPPFSTTLTWSEKHIVYISTLSSAYEYFKIKILDPSNPCGFIEIGKIVGGQALIITDNEDIIDDFSIGADDLAYKMPTEGFFRASNEKVKVEKLSLRFDKLSTVIGNPNYTRLWTMIKYVGETIPFLTVLDPNEAQFQITWGVLDNMPSRSFTVNRFTSLSLSVQEVY